MKNEPMNDAAHTSIRAPQSVARLSRTFSRSLSAVDLAEPLASLDDNHLSSTQSSAPKASSIVALRREMAAPDGANSITP